MSGGSRAFDRSFDRRRRRSFVRASRGTRARATREGSREDAVDVRGRRSRDDDDEEETRRRARRTFDDIRARERAIDDGSIGRARARCIHGSDGMG